MPTPLLAPFPLVVLGACWVLNIQLLSLQVTIRKLEDKCENAVSFREKASKLLEEAHRTLGRLEQVCRAFHTNSMLAHAGWWGYAPF